MTARKRCLMIGAGLMANAWIRRFLPNFADRTEVVGLVDVDRRALMATGDYLSLSPSRRFADMAVAFESVDADFCAIIVPPAFHKEAVMHAVRRRLPILSEKPIADTWPSCLDIYAAVKGADLKMQVIQNYRYEAPMLTLRQVLRDGTLGRINYVVARFAADYREYGSWGAPFRHEIPHAMLVDASIHHFDQIRNLTSADCASIAGWDWNPPWSSSKGEFCNLFVLRMTSGSYASYESSGTGAGEQNTWHEEHYRVECERGAVAIGRDRIVRTHRFTRGRGLVTEEVLPLKPAREGHNWLIDEFLNWLDGGPTPATVIDDNVKSAAMVFAALEASRTSQVIDVEAMVGALHP
ncbi:MAG: Gfo/Idh/MocA family oxidoreductase [Chloroflexi bacterium]|nr:Gfo/Idh/MocA family oxidoreductase [Chloroflexota bacterium]